MTTNGRSAEELLGLVGVDLGTGEWQEISQDQVGLFADATHDHQWIHVDPERARSGPFGQTIAHGFLTLALLPELVQPLLRVEGARLGVNYGLNRVRFPAPVPVGARIRAKAQLKEATAFEGGVQIVVETTVEIEGRPKPACVAETITRYYL
ncbi:MAG TPA: MaoC family dehydratase [Candidatus Dormibacteraeota bacterium]|nr:MaoC family dehydratase [Candidatus Dormibacteraeota bacterium]